MRRGFIVPEKALYIDFAAITEIPCEKVNLTSLLSQRSHSSLSVNTMTAKCANGTLVYASSSYCLVSFRMFVRGYSFSF